MIAVKPLEAYRIWLRYSDGVEGEIDLHDIVGRGVFSAWTERAVLEDIHINPSGALVWPGELDLCPDALYLKLTGKSVHEVFPDVSQVSIDA